MARDYFFALRFLPPVSAGEKAVNISFGAVMVVLNGGICDMDSCM
jgi:hypothetical protein